MIKRLSILIPVFNEEKTIKDVLVAINNLQLIDGIEKEVIIINDFSSDLSAKIIDDFLAENPSLNFVVKHRVKNFGKGSALHYGIKEATGDFIIPQDADLELNPNDINRILRKAIDEGLDVVYGSRFMNGTQGKKGLGLFANLLLSKLSRMTTGWNLTDMETCYKLMRASIVKSINLKEERFGFEPEVTAKLSKVKGIKYGEVPIEYKVRSYDEGKKIGWKDGFRALYCVLKYRF